MAPGTVGFPKARRTVVACPAYAMGVVEAALGRVGEEVVGGDDEAVSFEAGGW